MYNMYGRGTVPLQAQVSETAKLGKKNGKKKTDSIRLINKLCPAGKVFNKCIWNQHEGRKRHFS